MEYVPSDVLLSMQLCKDALRKTVSAGQLVPYIELSDTICSVQQALLGDWGDESAREFPSKETIYLEWFSEIVDLLDRSCEGTVVNTTSIGLSPLLGASFEMNSSDAQAFHQVANLLSFKAFLFGVREKFVRHPTKSEGILFFLEKVSTMFQKWKEVASNGILDNWAKFGFENSESMKEMLYQCTYGVLDGVTELVNHIIHMLELRGNYVEAARLGGEYIDFLEEHNTCLDPDETEFLYTEFYCFYIATAKLRFLLGEYEQAQQLFDKLLRMFQKLEDASGDVKIAIWREGKVEYTQPSVLVIVGRRCETLLGMIDTLKAQNRDSAVRRYEDMLDENRRKFKQLHPGDDIPEYAPESLQNPYLSELMEMASLIKAERYSEAGKAFERYKEETAREASFDGGSLTAPLLAMRHWLGFFFVGWSTGDYPSCLNYSTSKWQAHCRKFEVVLDMAEFTRDPMLTAKILEVYGVLIAERSLHLIKRKGKPGVDEDEDSEDEDSAKTDNLILWQDYADKLERWLKEELGLPTEDEQQEVAFLSCFSEPCGPGEHKKLLPPMLKSYRLLKCSIDTFSQLRHNWTKESADETGWLKLLESQKVAHSELQDIILHISEYCLQFIELGNVLGRNSSNHDVFKKMYDASAISSLVWAERGRARSLLHQLGPAYVRLSDHRNLQSIKEELVSFDLDEKAAFSCIMSCNFSCKGAVFVEYILSHHTSAAFVTYGGRVNEEHAKVAFQWVQFKCDEKKVAQLVGDFYKAVNPNDQGKVEYDEHLVAGYLAELFDMLITPIWELVIPGLRSNSTLVFVPDKILNRVPFALLQNPKNQKYLFEIHPIAVAPSLRVLYHCKRRLSYLESCPLKPGKAVLAMGDASYTSAVPLPRSGEEVTELAERFQGLVYKLEKYDATCANLLSLLEESSMSNEKHAFALIHLGVHCKWGSNFQTGAIQFAKPSQADKISKLGKATGAPNVASTSRDGARLQSVFGELGAVARDYGFRTSSSSSGDEMLRSEDIVANGLQWPTCLVVLSACNSSKGQIFGDGEVNLPRALMIAGVPASLVAQWKVVDDASPDLMRGFYDSLQMGQDVATALRSSMLHALRGKYKSNSASKIHEWGPFVVWGLPSVQLPKELWKEDALAQRALQGNSGLEREVIMSDVSEVQNLIASTDDGCTSENNTDIYDLIRATLHNSFEPLSPNSLKTIEQVFIKMPLEHLQKAEMQLEASEPELLSEFRDLMRFAQAIQGNFQVALDYANVLVADQTAPFLLYYRQERAVVLRLLGRYEEALTEFDNLLAPGFDYECQIERSCVKYLMGDKDEALEDARHAQRMRPEPGEINPCMISLHALPLEFREWISKVCNTTHLRNDLLIPAPSSSSTSFTGEGK